MFHILLVITEHAEGTIKLKLDVRSACLLATQTLKMLSLSLNAVFVVDRLLRIE